MTTPPDPADPFDTAELVDAVLATWAAQPARFREDANAEESLTHGYADRVLIELAANGVDAALAAGVPARLRISAGTGPDGRAELRVANTGAPLTAPGVRALASLRASAKRDQQTVGHFGVGFTSVLSLTDAPRVVSTTGGVRFSAERTAEVVGAQGVPALSAELRSRRGLVPTLRLCWPADDPDPVPDGYTTEVRLPLTRPAEHPESVDRLLARWQDAVLDHLMWALPDLQQVEMPDRTVARRSGPDSRVSLLVTDGPVPVDPDRILAFTQAQRSGTLPPDLLAQLPIEQRDRAAWWIRWVLPDDPDPGPPVGSAGSVGSVGDAGDADDAEARNAICAPTPTDVRLTVPARLIGTFVVDDTRRYLADGPINDFLLQQAVDGYLEMVAAVAPSRRLNLVPPSGFPAGDLDARLRADILQRWQSSPLLLTALGDPVSPSNAVAVRGIDAGTAGALAEAIPGLLPPTDSAGAAAQRRLGVVDMPVGAAVEALTSVVRNPEFWHEIYVGLADFDVDALSGLPVPLVDGRQVIGARGLLLPESGTAAFAARAAAALPGLRIVHPQAVHPLLERLGAVPADADALLTSPAIADEIAQLAADLDDGAIDPEDLAAATVRTASGRTGSDRSGPGRADQDGDTGSDPDSDSDSGQQETGPAVLAALALDLVAAGGRGDPAVLADLVLTADDGEPWPAGGLLLPASPLRALISDQDLPTVGAQWLELWDPDVLTAVGVRRSVQVISTADPRAGDLLPDLDDWFDDTDESGSTSDPDAPEITDLDLIGDADWPAFLAVVAADPSARGAVLAGGYTTWWLRRRIRFDGRRPGEFRSSEATELTGLFDPLPADVDLDPAITAAIGVLTDLGTAIDMDPQRVLDRFCDAGSAPLRARVPELTARLVAALTSRPELDLPPTIRTLAGTVRDVDEVAVPDGPWWAQVRPADLLVAPGTDPAATAQAFEIDLASERWESIVGGTASGHEVTSDGTRDDASEVDGTGFNRSAVEQPAPGRVAAGAAAASLGLDSGDLPELTVRPGLTVTIADTEHRVGWWPARNGFDVDGTAEPIADAVAWTAGRWSDRHIARAAVLANPDREVIESAFG